MISMCEDRWSYCGASLSRAEVMAIRYRLSYIGGVWVVLADGGLGENDRVREMDGLLALFLLPCACLC